MYSIFWMDCAISTYFAKYTFCNKKTRDVSIKIYSQLSDIPTFLLRDINISPTTYKCYEVIDNKHTPDLKTQYVLVRYKEVDTMLLATQMVHFDKVHFRSFSENIFINTCFEKFLKIVNLKLLVIGNLFAEKGNGVFWSKGISLSHDEKLSLLTQTIEEIRKKNKIAMSIVKDLLQLSLKHHDYTVREDDISMSLTIRDNWKNMDDYVSDLSHKYKQRAKKILKGFQDVEAKSLTLEEIIQQEALLHQLYMNMLDKQSIKLSIAHPQYFSESKKTLGSTFEIVGFYHASKLIAFQSYICHNEEQETHYIGMDYTAPKELYLYFNLLFYSIQLAIQRGRTKILFGRTALEAKASAGAEPFYHNTFFKIYNPFFRKIVYRFANRYDDTLGDGWKNRHPLKPPHT